MTGDESYERLRERAAEIGMQILRAEDDDERRRLFRELLKLYDDFGEPLTPEQQAQVSNHVESLALAVPGGAKMLTGD